MQAIVLAGGLGTRLRARVKDLPKAMAPIAGRPFLAYLLERLERAGCSTVVLATGYLSESIESHFGAAWGALQLRYSREPAPLGTGGAVVRALSGLPAGPTLVLNGDTWLDVDLAAFDAWAAQRPGDGAVVLREVADVSRFGAVRLQGERIVSFGEKAASGPGLINAGIYRLALQTFSRFPLPEVFSLEADFFQKHLAALNLSGHVCQGDFIDIGVPEEFDRAQQLIPAWHRR